MKMLRRGLSAAQTVRGWSNYRCYKTMPVNVARNEESFQRAVKIHAVHEKKLAAIHEQLAKGGGEKAVERHLKQGKLLVRDRLRKLLDSEDSFMELSALAGLGMSYGDVPNASVITGIGKVDGRDVMIIANDGTVKGGTVFPITLKKQLRSQQIAEELSLPCVYLVDSGGAFLPLQSEIFIEGGKAFYNEAIMSSLGIPQVAVVCGMCTAGGAYVPTMADESVIVHKTGTVYLGGPPLVKAATGEVVSTEDLGGATLHCSVSGCTDHFASSESEAYSICRDIITSLNLPETPPISKSTPPLYNQQDINGLIQSDHQDAHQLIAHVVDGSEFQEFKSLFGKDLVTGFAFISGTHVGLIANNSQHMSTDGAVKASHFVQLCDQRGLPIIFLQNMSENPNGSGEFMKAQAQFMSSVACSKVPKITIITGNYHGFSSIAMGSKSMGVNFIFNYPDASVCMVEPDELIKLTQTEIQDEKIIKFIQKSTTGLYAASNVLTDGIILPHQTRQTLSRCLEIFKFSRLMKRHISENCNLQTANLRL